MTLDQAQHAAVLAGHRQHHQVGRVVKSIVDDRIGHGRGDRVDRINNIRDMQNLLHCVGPHHQTTKLFERYFVRRT